MKRKSVTYLTIIRAEVSETCHEMTEAAFDFSNLATDYAMQSVDKVRTREDVGYETMMEAQAELTKAINAHKTAVKKLRSFFPAYGKEK